MPRRFYIPVIVMLLGLIVRSVSFEFRNKGEYMFADRRYCYRLTITDFASRDLIAWRPIRFEL